MKMAWRLSLHGVLMGCCALVLLPVIWMAGVSLSSESNPFGRYMGIIPQSFSVEGFVKVFQKTPIWDWFGNSLLVSLLLTAGQLLLGVLAAYAFSRYRFKGREPLFFFVLCTMMMPPQSIMLPMYLVVNAFDWVNSYKGVIVPQLASAYAIFVLRQFFMSVPRELDESSMIDGCNSPQTLLHIYVRASLPVLVGVALILFVNNWNDYYWPFLVIHEWAKLTLPVAIVTFRSESYIEWVPTMAAAMLSIMPAIIIYAFAQKHFTEGALNSGIKS